MSIRIGRGLLVAAVTFSAAVILGSGLLASGDDTPAAPDVWTAPARAAREKNPNPATDDSITNGRGIYGHQCLSCHGMKGKGDGPQAKDLTKPPGDLSNPKLWDETDGALFWKISTGKKPMPEFDKLTTDDERWNVINFIRTMAPAPATQPKGATQ